MIEGTELGKEIAEGRERSVNLNNPLGKQRLSLGIRQFNKE